jgi:hypothetical protein
MRRNIILTINTATVGLVGLNFYLCSTTGNWTPALISLVGLAFAVYSIVREMKGNQ